jgi:adenine-specific DNA-methyltransferase
MKCSGIRISTIRPLKANEATGEQALAAGERVFLAGPLTSETASESTLFEFSLNGHKLRPRKGGWKTGATGMKRLLKSNRLLKTKMAVFRVCKFIKTFSAILLR